MPKNERLRPTMMDVARLAGLSHQTVSRVLNKQPGVRPETERRVLEAIEKLGYRRNAFARALATNRTRLLGVVVFGTSWYGPAGTLHGIQQAARDSRYLVTIIDIDRITPDSVRHALHVLAEYSPDGFIIVTLKRSISEELRAMRLGVPMVAVEGGEGTPELPVVCVDQEHGAGLATEHLLSLGHHTVHHLAGPTSWLEAEARFRGWRSTLQAAGAPVPRVVRGDWTSRSGYEQGKKLLQRPGVTAIFAANDQMALGLLMACRESGVRVPEDVSVVGFDNMPESAYFSPPLTTVVQDFQAVGRTSVTLLLNMVEHEEVAISKAVVTPTLVIRSSSGPPPRSYQELPSLEDGEER